MPRVKQNGAQDGPAEQQAVTAKVPENRKRDSFDGLQLDDLVPYDWNEAGLEEAVVEDRTQVNNDGQRVPGRSITLGKPKFYLEQNARPGGDWINIIGVYKNGKGTAQRNIRTLKPKDLNRIRGAHPLTIQQVREDNAIFEKLKKKGLPVVVKTSVCG